jgi:riboflavin synthase alpha subunit
MLLTEFTILRQVNYEKKMTASRKLGGHVFVSTDDAEVI